MVRNHLCLHHRYPIGIALFPLLRASGSMPGVGARVQNLGHLQFASKFWLKFLKFLLLVYISKILIGLYSFLDHRYPFGLN